MTRDKVGHLKLMKGLGHQGHKTFLYLYLTLELQKYSRKKLIELKEKFTIIVGVFNTNS